MQCELCLSKDDHPTLGDEPWSTSVCGECAVRPDVVDRLQDLWILRAVLETGGAVISDAAGVRYRYQRSHWEVTFRREMLESAIRAKSNEALYAELYRWHRDPEYALMPSARERVREAINGMSRCAFECFAAGSVSVYAVYSHDGTSGISCAIDPSGLVDLGHPDEFFPGKRGIGWMRDLFGAELCGDGNGFARFRIRDVEVEIPYRLVHLRDEREVSQIVGRTAVQSA